MRTSEPAKSPSSGLSATFSPWNGEKGLCEAHEGATTSPARSGVTACRIKNNSETGVECTEETRQGVSGEVGELQKQVQNSQATRQPKLLDRLRDKMRLLHYSIRTESAYSDWITRYCKFHREPDGTWRHPAVLGSADIEKFLTYLAVESKVSASTQNQALSAILFLYKLHFRRMFYSVPGIGVIGTDVEQCVAVWQLCWRRQGRGQFTVLVMCTG